MTDVTALMDLPANNRTRRLVTQALTAPQPSWFADEPDDDGVPFRLSNTELAMLRDIDADSLVLDIFDESGVEHRGGVRMRLTDPDTLEMIRDRIAEAAQYALDRGEETGFVRLLTVARNADTLLAGLRAAPRASTPPADDPEPVELPPEEDDDDDEPEVFQAEVEDDEPEPEDDDLADLSVVELRDVARNEGMEGFSQLRRADLIAAIQEHRQA